MDAVFFLDEEARARFIRTLAETIGCTYLCLWSYYPLTSNVLLSMGGWYNDESNQPSSSSGSLARRFFNAYLQTSCTIENGFSCVPGLAFKEGIPYIELKELELMGRASTDTQRQFYQEAQIKTAAFMGCKSGEIEIGMSNIISRQINMEMAMKNWFPEDFSQQSQFKEPPRQPDQNRPSSSSSSLRSLSVGSPEYSSLLFSMPSSSYMPESRKEAPIEQAIRPTTIPILPHQQTMQTYNRLRNIQFPNPESDDAAMTRAMLAVISSPSSYQPQQNQTYSSQVSRETSAFKKYISVLAPKVQMKANSRKQNLLKRAIRFFSDLNLRNTIEAQAHGNRPPTSTQLHHMMSERKRREKLNESFQALRSLLPPGSKKDKASVLSNTRDYLSALKAEVFELKQKNQLLGARLSPSREASKEAGGSSNERVDIRITQASESTSEEREIDLRVTVRGDSNVMDLIIHILEFLKQVKDVSLVSMEADTQLQQTNSFNRVILRLKIQGNEWDESAFREAITRVVDDLAR